MKKLLKLFKVHALAFFIILISTLFEFAFLYFDYLINGNWFFQRNFSAFELGLYLSEFLLFAFVMFGAFLSDKVKVRRIQKLEDIKEVEFIDDVIVKVLEEPEFTKKLSIAVSSLNNVIPLCKSAVIDIDSGVFYFKDRITKSDEKFIKDEILKASNRADKAHSSGFLYEEIEIYDFKGAVILKPCKQASKYQIEFLKKYKRILLPVVGSAYLFVALKKSKDVSERMLGRYKLLHSFISDLQKSATVEETYWKLVKIAAFFFNAKSATVLDVSSDDIRNWRFVAIKNTPNYRLNKMEEAFKSGNYKGNLTEIKSKKVTLYIPDTRKYPGWVNIENAPISWLGIPIVVNGKVIAILNIDGEIPNKFSNEDIVFAQALSDIVSTIVQRLKYMEQLNVSATTDSLTGLYNKREFERRIKEETDRAFRYDRKLSLAIFDLDKFKQWNDTYGHLEGDRLLSMIGKLITSSIRSSDIAFRFGGDEFVIILPETDAEKAVYIIGKLSKKLSEVHFHEPVHFSVGIAEYRKGETPEELFERADAALYRAKKKKKEEDSIEIAV